MGAPRAWALLALLGMLVVAGCANARRVPEPRELDAPTGVAGSSSNAGAAGSAPIAGSSADVPDAPEAPPEPEDCVVQNVPAGMPEDCRQLDALVLEHPVVTDESGDGVLLPGESADIAVTWREILGLGVSWYPGVQFSTDAAGVALGESPWRYAFGACQVETVHTSVTLSMDLELGRPIRIRAQVAMLNTECPDAAMLEIPIAIGDLPR